MGVLGWGLTIFGVVIGAVLPTMLIYRILISGDDEIIGRLVGYLLCHVGIITYFTVLSVHYHW